ncbi:MAG TPA: hypothetical protein VHZ51_31830, partial [Ktedonobacteraceae bacterium]|nr:hypothetical protein [Ktedonobacteraceae bacterium]
MENDQFNVGIYRNSSGKALVIHAGMNRRSFEGAEEEGMRPPKGLTGNTSAGIIRTNILKNGRNREEANVSSFAFNPPSQESPAFTPGEEWRVLIWGLGWVELFTDMAFDILCEMLYTCSMKQLITAKLKLHTDPAQFQALRTTQLAYR